MIALSSLPWTDAAALARSGAPVWVLVNPTEYHGPHLSLHNDRVLSLAIARLLQERVQPGSPLLVGADLRVGVDPAAGPGGRGATPATLRALLLEACRALVALGAREVVLMTFHGAPLHNLVLQDGVDWLRARGVRAVAPFHAVMRAMSAVDADAWRPAVASLPPPIAEDLLERLPLDLHAGFFETSLALHLAPETVSPVHRELPACPRFPPDPMLARLAAWVAPWLPEEPARELRFAARAAGWNGLRPFPGYTSAPAHANAEAGAVFTEALVDLMAPLLAGMLAGEDPPPAPFRWLRALTLDGRLGPEVPEEAVAAFRPRRETTSG